MHQLKKNVEQVADEWKSLQHDLKLDRIGQPQGEVCVGERWVS